VAQVEREAAFEEDDGDGEGDECREARSEGLGAEPAEPVGSGRDAESEQDDDPGQSQVAGQDLTRDPQAEGQAEGERRGVEGPVAQGRVLSTSGKIFPGFRMPSGSNAALTARETSISALPRARGR